MSNFMDGIKSTLNNECNVSVTENGAVGFRTTGKALLDLNFAVASLRSASEHDISQRFTKAFFEDKLMAIMLVMSVVAWASAGCSAPVWCLWRRSFPSTSPLWWHWYLSTVAGTICGACWIRPCVTV